MKQILYILLLSITVISCAKKPQQYNDPIPVHDSFSIASKYVNETRVINIWTPPKYNKNTDSLPVIYMPDGGIKEDFPHIANTLSKLIENKRIPPIILVGIENTLRGRDLTGASVVKEDEQYCPLSDGAKNFRAFITEELVTEINTKYRTTDKKGIIGESLAGLFVMETFMLQPNEFDFYISIDPSLWWNNHYLEKNAARYLSNISSKTTKLWFAGSAAEDISVHTNKLAKTLENTTSDALIWNYSDEPNEKHSTIFRATKEKALIWALKQK